MNFTLDTEEFNKAQSKNNVINKLAFAVMLKFFQIENRYPTNADLIDQALIDSLTMQLNCHDSNLSNYDWSSNNRTVKRFHHEIRTLLGYRQMTLSDSQILIAWLIDNVLPEAPTLIQSRYIANQNCKKPRRFYSTIILTMKEVTLSIYF